VNDIFDMTHDNGTDVQLDKAVDKFNDYVKPQVNMNDDMKYSSV